MCPDKGWNHNRQTEVVRRKKKIHEMAWKYREEAKREERHRQATK